MPMYCTFYIALFVNSPQVGVSDIEVMEYSILFILTAGGNHTTNEQIPQLGITLT